MQQIDPHGRAVVVLLESPHPFGPRHEVQESGILVRDGDALSVEHRNGTTRSLSEFEKSRLLLVMPTNHIPECAGYQFFILKRSDETCIQCGTELEDRWLDSGGGIIVCPNCDACHGVFDGITERIDEAQEVLFEPDDDNSPACPTRVAHVLEYGRRSR